MGCRHELVQSALYSEDEEERDALIAQMRAEELHRYADGFNWDDEVHPLWLVANHPDCDFGMALLLFWRADPYFLWWTDEDDRTDGAAALARELAVRICAGAYPHRHIRFDPLGDEVAPRLARVRLERGGVERVFIDASPGEPLK